MRHSFHSLGGPRETTQNGTEKENGAQLHQLCFYNAIHETQLIESDIRDYLKSIYWVLERRRLDVSFEKMDIPPCPRLPNEDKYRIGVEKKATKSVTFLFLIVCIFDLFQNISTSMYWTM